MKVAIISHKTSNLINARGDLIKKMIRNGHQVIAICNEEDDKDGVKELGAVCINVKFDRLSKNVFSNLKYLMDLAKVLKKEKVDVVLSYTIKPIIFGTIAAKIAKVNNIYILIAGMGYIYSEQKLKIRLIRKFCDLGYKIAFKFSKKVIFQNKEDKEEMISKKFITRDKTEIVDGSGVDLFKFKKEENKIKEEFVFLMISRILKVKGIEEYCKAAKIVKNAYPKTRFLHIGEMENSTRGIKESELKKYKKIVEFKGRKDNVYEYIKKANVVVLPSYLREGIPRVLLEALAVGRPIITTDERGCRETVIENENGYLVKSKNVEELADKMIEMIKKDSEELKLMSNNSYKLAVKRFDINIINKEMLKIMEL